MAIDPKLLVIKPVDELESVTGLQAGELLFYDGSNNLKKIDIDIFNNLSKTAKPLKPTDATPTQEGLYKPTQVGTYTNAGGLIAQEGYDTLFFFNGTTWTKSEFKFPQAPANLRLWSALPFSKDEQVVKDNVIYIALQNVLATDVPGVSDKWKSLRSEDVRIALKWFLEQNGGTEFLDKTFEISNVASYGNLYGISNNADKLLSKTGALINYSEAGVDVNFWQNIPTKANGIRKIIAKLRPYGNSPSNPSVANIIGTKSNGDVIPLVMYLGDQPPSTLQTYELDITEYESISVGLVVLDSNPNSNTQTIEFYKVASGLSLENSVKNYIDENAGGSISPQFDPTTTTQPQGGKQIADWILSNEKPAGASSDFEVVDEWTLNSKSATGFQSIQYNTKSIQFIDATGVSKLLLTMPTKLTSAEPGDVVYGKKLDGTFQTIYHLPNQNLNAFEVLIPQNTYLHIYVNSYWFTGQNTSGHLVKVFRGSGTQEKIYGDAKTVEALAKASKFFIETGAGEEHTIVAGLSGQYSEGDGIYGSGSYRNILAYPATGVTKIKFTALTAGVSGEQ